MLIYMMISTRSYFQCCKLIFFNDTILKGSMSNNDLIALCSSLTNCRDEIIFRDNLNNSNSPSPQSIQIIGQIYCHLSKKTCKVWYLIVSIPDLCTLTYFERWQYIISWIWSKNFALTCTSAWRSASNQVPKISCRGSVPDFLPIVRL